MRNKLILLLILTLVSTSMFSVQAQNAEGMALPGLDGEVTVQYDSFGIPHIYATTEHDLFMVQGYITAQDRWWHMEWTRRQARGTLSEILGENLVGTDTFLRTLRLVSQAEQDWEVISDEARAMIQAYTDGINAWLDGKEPADAAMEYNMAALLGADLALDPWTPIDTMAIGQVAAIQFEQGHIELELIKLGITEASGPLAALLLMPGYDYDNAPLISEPGWQPETAARPVDVAFKSPLDASYFPDWAAFPFPTFQETGSNSWAISGDLTETGMPILANDPHIGQNQPSVWYEIGLHCVEVTADCGFDAYGYVFPGSPGILIGHNANLAWGMTVSGLDTIDIYTLKVNPDNPLQYMYNGEWVDMEVVTETINVARGEPVEVPVRVTRYGPMINELVGFEQPMAARSVSAVPCTGIEILYWLPRAKNWDEFQAGVAKFDFAGQNFMYADVEGNIAVISGGRIPIRAEGHDGTTPVPGGDDTFAWQGFVDPMDNPRVFNPDAGYLVAANNAFMRPEDFDTVFGTYFNYGERASRIETLIQASELHSVESVIAIQNDNFNPAAAIVIPVLSEIDFGDDDLNTARNWLSHWDYMNEADSPQAALFNALWLKLVPLAFDELDAAGGVSGGTHEIFLMRNMIHGAHPLWNNPELGTNDRDEILKIALQAAWDMLVEQLGDNPDEWRWDALHISRPRHVPFGQLPGGVNPGLDIMLNDINLTLNRSYGVDGGLESINNQRWDVRNGNFVLAGAVVSMRMIIDFSDLDNSRFVHEMGQSGDPFSAHYDDLSSLWAAGEYHPYGFTLDAVDAITVNTVTFTPAD